MASTSSSNSNNKTYIKTGDANFTNLVFEGGGVKGLANAGAFKILENAKMLQKVDRVGGASAGAITAMLIALGFTAKEVGEQIAKVDMASWADDSWGVSLDLNRLRKKFGYHKGEIFEKWAQDMVETKTGIRDTTFAQLKTMYLESQNPKTTYFKDRFGPSKAPIIQNNAKNFKELYIVTVELMEKRTEIFSHENTSFMNTSIADAVRASMAIPLYFAMKTIKDKNGIKRGFVDGGTLANFHFKMFNEERFKNSERFKVLTEAEYKAKVEKENYRYVGSQMDFSRMVNQSNIGSVKTEKFGKIVNNEQTLGFRLDSKEEIAHLRFDQKGNTTKTKGTIPSGFLEYMKILASTLIGSQQTHSAYYSSRQQSEQTVYVNTLGLGTTDFDLNDLEKNCLKLSGTISMLEWLLVSKSNNNLWDYFQGPGKKGQFYLEDYLREHLPIEELKTWETVKNIMTDNYDEKISDRTKSCVSELNDVVNDFQKRMKSKLSRKGGLTRHTLRSDVTESGDLEISEADMIKKELQIQ